MNTYRFSVQGVLDSWLDPDEIKRRLIVGLCGEDPNGDLTCKISADEIEVIDYTRCNIEQICPHDNTNLQYRVFDIDGTNLEEHAVCPICGYGSPELR